MAPPSEDQDGPEWTAINEALYRRPMYFGLPKDVLRQLGFLFVGAHTLAWGVWYMHLVVFFVFGYAHSKLAAACAKDPHAVDLFWRALHSPDVTVRTPPRSRPAQSGAYWRALPRAKSRFTPS